MKAGLRWLLVTLALTHLAQAQSNSALAETLYQDGKRLMKEKKYAEACPKLAESQKLEPATGTVLNLAACYDAWGKHATAWAHYNDALTAARREGQDYRVKYAEEQLKALESKLTRLQVDLAPGADVAGLEISLDGRVLPSAALGAPLPVDPGAHVIAASAPGKKPLRIEINASAPNSVVKALVPALENGPPGPASAPSTEAQSSGSEPPPAQAEGGETSGSKTVGLVVAGAGVVAIGVGVVFHFMGRLEQRPGQGALPARREP